MTSKRQVEIYSAECIVCNKVVELVEEIACPSCEVSVHDMHDQETIQKAEQLNIQSIPAVVINGMLVKHEGKGYSIDLLRAAGIGQPIT